MDSWTPTLEAILYIDVPIIFTTFSKQEALEQKDILDRLDARFIRIPSENRWRGALAYEEITKRGDIYYMNHWWYIVKGRNRRIDESGDLPPTANHLSCGDI